MMPRRNRRRRHCRTAAVAALLVVPAAALSLGATAGATEPPTTSSSPTAAAPEAAAWSNRRLVPGGTFDTGLDRWATGGAVTSVGPGSTGTGRAIQLTDPDPASWAQARSARIAVAPGEQVTLTAMARRVSGTGGTLYLEFWGADGVRLTNSAGTGSATAQRIGVQNGVLTSDVGSSTAWHQLTLSAVVPDRAVTMTALLYSGQTVAGTVQFDEVSVASVLPSPIRVEDPGFENNRDLPAQTSWTLTTSAGTKAGYQCTDAPTDSASYSAGATLCQQPPQTFRPHSGRRSLYFDDSSTTGSVSALSRAMPTPAAGTTVTASAWLMARRILTTEPVPGALYLEFRNSSGAIVSGGSFSTKATTASAGAWARIQVSATVPAGADRMTVRAYSTQADRGQTTWDDVDLTAAGQPGYASAIGRGPVLFVGDDRVEATSNMTRVSHPGTPRTAAGLPAGQVLAPTSAGDANPRPALLDTAEAPDRLFYIAGGNLWTTAMSPADTDGTAFSGTRTATGQPMIHPVRNPAYTSGSSVPKYFGLRYAAPGADPATTGYFAYQSNDGITWTQRGNTKVLPGLDVAYVSHDGQRFVATIKGWLFDPRLPRRYDRMPRTAAIATSTDFTTWTVPRSVFAADIRDFERVEQDNPAKAPAPSAAGKFQRTADVYGAPVFRYGEQYLAIPWIFDITWAGWRDDNGYDAMYKDTGRATLQWASSTDLQRWSRPDRTPIVTPGAAGSWNAGFHQPSQAVVSVGDEVRYYYGSFAGEHSCDAAAQAAGRCTDHIGQARLGVVTWKRDRFVSLRAGSAEGTLETRVLRPTGSALRLNAAVGSGGAVRVEVLDAAGAVLPGYSRSDSSVLTTDSLAAPITWGGKNLPAGDVRLRIVATSADVYSFTIA